MTAVVEVRDLEKRYCRGLKRSLLYGVQDIARDALARPPSGSGPLRKNEFASLDGVSFDVRRGEGVAVVGANGAGKSTLLKILHGLVKPDGGSVRIRGRVGALIELGAGFDPVLSGRENIAVLAQVAGHDPREIHRLQAGIVEFAGIEEALDAPVRYYSSGMTARLAFAVAAHLDPDVLLVDEVLAVGDIAFQRRCISFMTSYLEKGGAVVFVSHSPYQIQLVCERGILLEHGRCTAAGSAVDVLAVHMSNQSALAVDHGAAIVPEDREATSDEPVSIRSLSLRAVGGGPPRTDEPAEFVLRCHTVGTQTVRLGFTIWSPDGQVCVTGAVQQAARSLPEGGTDLVSRIHRLPLFPGAYQLRAAIIDGETGLALASVGFDDAPSTVMVHADPSGDGNALGSLGQLTTLGSVSWPS